MSEHEKNTGAGDEPASTNSEPPVDPQGSTDVQPSTDPRGSAEEPIPAGPGEGSGSASPPRSPFPSWITTALAFSIPSVVLLFLPPLWKSGLWDPYELNVADLGRRIAIHLFHVDALVLSGADNSMPHLNDLGRPELPFTSIALGFKLFGLHEWSGRLPLAVWGVLGAFALYLAVSRLVDRRAGLYSVLALSTMPLYFVQARTMLGDIVTMAGVSMAFSGFVVAMFDRREDGASSVRVRVAFLLMGLVGLVVGYESRGALLGVAVPLGAVGLSWLVAWAGGHRASDLFGDLVGGFAFAFGVVAVVRTTMAIEANDVKNLSLSVGAMIRPPGKYPTFDMTIGHLGHALAPWSAFIPFAIGRLFIAPPSSVGVARSRESQLRVSILVGATVAFAAHAYLASKTELIAFCAPAILAAACGIAIRDFERGAHPSVAVGVGTAVFLAVFRNDFKQMPEKAYQAFAVVGATFPDTFKTQSKLLWTIALVGFAGVAFLTWVERDAERTPFDPKNYLKVLDQLREAWDGLLALIYFALVAGASLAGLAIWLGNRLHWTWIPTSSQVRDGALNAWWLTAIVPLAVIYGLFFATDVWLWAFGRAKGLSWASLTRGFEPFEELYARIKEEKDASVRTAALTILVPLMVLAVPGAVLGYMVSHQYRVLVAVALALPSGIALFLIVGFLGELLQGRRTAGMVFLGTLLGVVLSGGYYPALANQLSPKEVFESYEKTHKGSEPLALFGVGGRTAAYYTGGQPPSFSDVQSAYTWLMDGPDGSRRFMAMRAEELARLNHAYRQHAEPRQNLPVLDARSSQILLVTSQLRSGEKNQNPLDTLILSEPPKPQRPIKANLEDKLEVLGYDIIDVGGRPVDAVRAGKEYRMRTYFKVLAPITTEWQAFIHIDGNRRRHNGDHKPMGGKYPFALWLPGDLLVDEYEFKLEPNFAGGMYTVYFGLFVGDTRFKVTSGPSDGDNRINGGGLRVQ